MDMISRYFIIGLCMLTMGSLRAQEASRADRLYFEYSYQEAVRAYEEAMKESLLNAKQQLNLADAYFRTGQYGKASDTFMEVYKKDSLMTNAQFNTMLQALSKTSGPERAKAFLSTRSDQLSPALMENTAFNYEILEDVAASELDYEVYKPVFNSSQSDFAPAFFGPDQLLFSSSRPLSKKETYTPTGESYLNIYATTLQGSGQAGRAAPVPWIPGIEYHQATPYYSDQLQAIFYVQSNMEEEYLAFDPEGKNSLAICRAGRDGSFEYLFRDLSTSFYYPFYDDRSGKLYFAADFDKGYGGTDLYYVYTNRGQIMSEPVNLGPQVNTPGNEIAPFIFDGSLYFSSDVFYGQGGMDIYKSEVLEGDFYSIPVNLGPGINSSRDDFGFIIREDSEGGYLGYFASNRPGGLGSDDIYGFRVTEKPGLNTLVVRGNVQDPGGNGIEKAFVRLYDPDDKLIRETYSGQDGVFRMEIPWRENVRVVAGRERFGTVDLGGTALNPEMVSGQPLKIELTPVEAVVLQQADRTLLRMERFHFDNGSTRITPQIAGVLDQAAKSLMKFPDLRIQIEAHTDSRGSANRNLELSQKRAEAIRDYLVSVGVAPETFKEVTGYGEQQIINNCTDGVYCLDMLHKQNERYPFVVVNYSNL